MQQGNEKNRMLTATGLAIALTLLLASCTLNPEVENAPRWPTRTPTPTNTLVLADIISYNTSTPQPTQVEIAALPIPIETPIPTDREKLEGLIRNSLNGNHYLYLTSRWNVDGINAITGVVGVDDSNIPGKTYIDTGRIEELIRSSLNISDNIRIIFSSNTTNGYQYEITTEQLRDFKNEVTELEIVIGRPGKTVTGSEVKTKIEMKDEFMIVTIEQ